MCFTSFNFYCHPQIECELHDGEILYKLEVGQTCLNKIQNTDAKRGNTDNDKNEQSKMTRGKVCNLHLKGMNMCTQAGAV